jgi:hypothetical protein
MAYLMNKRTASWISDPPFLQPKYIGQQENKFIEPTKSANFEPENDTCSKWFYRFDYKLN